VKTYFFFKRVCITRILLREKRSDAYTRHPLPHLTELTLLFSQKLQPIYNPSPIPQLPKVSDGNSQHHCRPAMISKHPGVPLQPQASHDEQTQGIIRRPSRLDDCLPRTQPPGCEAIVGLRNEVLPSTELKPPKPDFSAICTSQQHVIDCLRVLITQGTRVDVPEAMAGKVL
jgi:hypothetical protein